MFAPLGWKLGTLKANCRETLPFWCAGRFRMALNTIVACGGDGTVHEILQSLAGTQVALAVILFRGRRMHWPPIWA